MKLYNGLPGVKLHTYFEDINNNPDEVTLVNLWKERCTKLGYEPVVLSRQNALGHPKYTQLLQKIRTFHTTNQRAYEDACYIRWLAIANVAKHNQVTVMTDYDCIPYKYLDLKPTSHLTIGSAGGICPHLVIGTQAGYEMAVNALLTHVGLPGVHTSDNTIFAGLDKARLYTHLHLAANYNMEHWTTYPFIHYPNSLMGQYSPRYLGIPILEANFLNKGKVLPLDHTA